MPFVKVNPNEYLVVGRGGRAFNYGTAVGKFLWPGTTYVIIPSRKLQIDQKPGIWHKNNAGLIRTSPALFDERAKIYPFTTFKAFGITSKETLRRSVPGPVKISPSAWM